MLASEPAAAPLEARVPPHPRLLILSMLAKDPAARPSAEEIASNLAENILPIREPEQPAMWRRPNVWLAILAGLLLVNGAIGWFRFRKRDSLQFANLSIRPLTSQSGWEASPALSPGGQSIAFYLGREAGRHWADLSEAAQWHGPVMLTHSQLRVTSASRLVA
jgi:WD40-like Beta Propeller Repeat